MILDIESLKCLIKQEANLFWMFFLWRLKMWQFFYFIFFHKRLFDTLKINSLLECLTSHRYRAGQTKQLIEPHIYKPNCIYLSFCLPLVSPSAFELQFVKLPRCQIQTGTIHISTDEGRVWAKIRYLFSDLFITCIFPASQGMQAS